MSDATPGGLPPHIQVTDVDIALEPGPGASTVQPVVQGLRVRVSEQGLQALAQCLVAEADRRAPLGLSLRDVRVNEQGIDLALRVQQSILRGDLALSLALSAPDGQLLRVELTEVDIPAWIPLDLVLEEAVRRAGSVVRRVPGNQRAFLLDPAALLARFGVPGRFAPGYWDVATSAAGIELGFRGSAAGA